MANPVFLNQGGFTVFYSSRVLLFKRPSLRQKVNLATGFLELFGFLLKPVMNLQAMFNLFFGAWVKGTMTTLDGC